MINSQQCFSLNGQFNQVISYAEDNMNLKQVPMIKSEISEAWKSYRKKVEEEIIPLAEKEDAQEDVYERVEKRSKVFKRLAIGSAIGFLPLLIIASILQEKVVWLILQQLPQPFNVLLDFVLTVLLFGILIALPIVSVIMLVIFSIKKKAEYKKWRIIYNDYISALNGLNEPYSKLLSQRYYEIENLYINSLSPEARELYLLRKESERQHKEQMRNQQIQHEEQMHIHREIEKQMREQTALTGELLDIERRKEEFYGGY